ncbi:ZIP family metal transporter [Macrococcus equipercicus]|uniref:ZIP family metal transporter n=1 Tax=Macrococcus equipercicus TaxID=69967 RepID=A0A9Q9F1I2_9STAP|nr:ZIP family metal transporter [Macrococcus equipercicus]KAA1039496.1 ZIP family metal transporter [Macrococcus equipercicus]UTH13780.1 ZIP family metal transporter [Macrococcus equipercicus]
MGMALLWGLVSGGAVLLGSIISLLVKIPKKLLGFIMAFGVGVLIGAATFELLQESLAKGEIANTIIGFLVGAVVFTVLEAIISSKGGKHRKRSAIPDEENNKQDSKKQSNNQSSDAESGAGIFIGTVMDAIPESIMLGVSLIGGKGVSLLLLLAIFISNIPEGLSSTSGMLKSGNSKKKILSLFIAVTVIAGLSSLGGYIFLDNADPKVLAFISSFAAGGIITMIGATMMPEAYEDGGALVGLITAFGVLTSVLLDHLG